VTDEAAPARRRMAPEARRAQILDSARGAFVKNGFSARTKDIAADAGVNQGLVYHYFDSKEKLFEEAVIAPLEQLVRDLAVSSRKLAEGADKSPEDRGQILQHMHDQMLEQMVEVVPLLGIALFSDPVAGQTFFRDRLKVVIDELAVATAQGLSGWARPSLDPAAMALATFGLHFGFAMQLALTGQGDREAMSRQLHDVFWLGLEKR
jgi:AcrR family transcriptional regulator